ncbi:hypothetical protein COV19_02540 [Candidatus Woesearchaeota archaeon CG10_big_fil_rev_8_21_14_0_10_44_13]|nr:MAG: hypothetical protein COV19_02540 [Candidatus Woesearchaeota archaeon CG10_big_fil_rev_8_21_14_0_10_44_13]
MIGLDAVPLKKSGPEEHEPHEKRLNPLREYAGALLDVDGTLVDSEPLHYLENKIFFAAYGVSITKQTHIDYWIKGDGKGTQGILDDNKIEGRDDLGERLDLGFAKREREKIFINHLLPNLNRKHGALEFLQYLAALLIPSAAVSTGYRQSVSSSLEISGLRRYISLIIAKEDVIHTKPHPEPYLKGAEAIKVPIKDCVVVEDSPKGIISARRAGAGFTIACPDEWTRDLDFTGEAEPDKFVKSLTEIIMMDLFWLRH